MIRVDKKSSKDLTQGNIFALILTYTVPVILGQIFQNLYNSVDSIVVGQCVDVSALAAVSCSNDISQLIVGFFTGLSTGSSILFSRLYGQRRMEDLRHAIHTGLCFAVIVGVGMALVGVLICPALLHLVNCPEDIWDSAVVYLRIYLVGVFFTSVYNVLSGVLRAVGDSRSPFLFLVVASLTNVVLDFVFVMGLHMGVAGVAIATICSQMLSCCLILVKMTVTDDVYRLHWRELRVDGKILRQVAFYGLPAAIQMCIVSFSNLFIQRYLNDFGASAIAGVGAAKKIDGYVSMLPQSVGLTLASFTSQNLGAERYDRVFRGVRIGLGMCWVSVAAIGGVILCVPEFFARIFTDDAEAIHYCVTMMQIMIPFYLVMSIHSVCSNVIRGYGKSALAMVLVVMGMVVFRQIFMAISMHLRPCVENVIWSYPVGWSFAAAMELVCYLWLSRPYRKAGLRKATAGGKEQKWS